MMLLICFFYQFSQDKEISHSDFFEEVHFDFTPIYALHYTIFTIIHLLFWKVQCDTNLESEIFLPATVALCKKGLTQCNHMNARVARVLMRCERGKRETRERFSNWIMAGVE